MKCNTCKSQRWLLKRAKWDDDVLAGEALPFDRGIWPHVSPVAIAAAIRSGVLTPCQACNKEKRAPWHKAFGKVEESAPGAQGGGDGSAF